MENTPPLKIYDQHGYLWSYHDSNGKIYHTYQTDRFGDTCEVIMKSFFIEKDFTREIIEPQSKVIVQGRWECAPASLSMLIGESLWNVKRALVRCGWNNDDRGSSNSELIEAGKLLGVELVKGKMTDPKIPAVLSVPSINMKGRWHAVFWNGSEILDPNFGKSERKHYSPQWNINTIFRKEEILMIKGNKS